MMILESNLNTLIFALLLCDFSFVNVNHNLLLELAVDPKHEEIQYHLLLINDNEKYNNNKLTGHNEHRRYRQHLNIPLFKS